MRRMSGNGKGFNVASFLNQFILTARSFCKDFYILPLCGQDNKLCTPVDIPHPKEGTTKYFRNRITVNNITGSIKIRPRF
jgi:hypothetical protein